MNLALDFLGLSQEEFPALGDIHHSFSHFVIDEGPDLLTLLVEQSEILIDIWGYEPDQFIVLMKMSHLTQILDLTTLKPSELPHSIRHFRQDIVGGDISPVRYNGLYLSLDPECLISKLPVVSMYVNGINDL